MEIHDKHFFAWMSTQFSINLYTKPLQAGGCLLDTSIDTTTPPSNHENLFFVFKLTI